MTQLGITQIILHEVADEFDIQVTDFDLKTNSRRFVRPKQAATFFLRAFTTMCWRDIQKVFNDPEHTTSAQRAKACVKNVIEDDEASRQIERLRARIQYRSGVKFRQPILKI